MNRQERRASKNRQGATGMLRVSWERLDRIRERLSELPSSRLGRGETVTMTDRQIVDLGLGWLEGRLLGDAYTRAEAIELATKVATDTLAIHLKAKVDVMLVDGIATFQILGPDGIASEVEVTLALD